MSAEGAKPISRLNLSGKRTEQTFYNIILSACQFPEPPSKFGGYYYLYKKGGHTHGTIF